MQAENAISSGLGFEILCVKLCSLNCNLYVNASYTLKWLAQFKYMAWI
jgi:hypothetical protein